jgi:hypothetical protein
MLLQRREVHNNRMNMKHSLTLLLITTTFCMVSDCVAQNTRVEPDSLAAICTLSFDPAVEVEVRDERTGALLTPRATVVVSDGVYSDTLKPRILIPDENNRELIAMTVAGAGERAGTYRVRVLVPGYHVWIRSGITVSDGECHVQTRKVSARMRRL